MLVSKKSGKYPPPWSWERERERERWSEFVVILKFILIMCSLSFLCTISRYLHQHVLEKCRLGRFQPSILFYEQEQTIPDSLHQTCTYEHNYANSLLMSRLEEENYQADPSYGRTDTNWDHHRHSSLLSSQRKTALASSSSSTSSPTTRRGEKKVRLDETDLGHISSLRTELTYPHHHHHHHHHHHSVNPACNNSGAYLSSFNFAQRENQRLDQGEDPLSGLQQQGGPYGSGGEMGGHGPMSYKRFNFAPGYFDNPKKRGNRTSMGTTRNERAWERQEQKRLFLWQTNKRGCWRSRRRRKGPVCICSALLPPSFF